MITVVARGAFDCSSLFRLTFFRPTLAGEGEDVDAPIPGATDTGILVVAARGDEFDLVPGDAILTLEGYFRLKISAL